MAEPSGTLAPVTATQRRHRRLVGLGRMSRPDQVLLIAAVYAAGVLAALAGRDVLAGAAVLWGLAALLPGAISVHLINEYADRDTDALTVRTRFSGGSGALRDLDLDATLPLHGAVVAATAAAVVAAAGAILGDLPTTALLLLAIGILGGWQYSVGPLALSRHGWGEITNAGLGGLLLPLYGVAAATGQVTAEDLAVFAPFSLLVFVNLLETQWADRRADRATGKRTLVARTTAPRVRALAAGATVVAYGLLGPLSPAAIPPPVAAASLAALPLSMLAVWRLTRRDTPGPAVLAMLVLLTAQMLAWAGVAASPGPAAATTESMAPASGWLR